MFKKIAKILSVVLDQNTNKNGLASRVKTEFKSDYIDNRDFIDSFPPDIAPSIEETILNTYRNSNNPEGEATLDDYVYHIFGGLQSLYISLWLAERGYGEKLALKMKQLLYTDSYGDMCFDDWNKELHRFVEDRLYNLDAYLKSTIPEKYQEYAEQLGMGYQLNIQIFNPDYSLSELVESLAFSISLEVDPYYEKLCDSYTTRELDAIENPYDYEHAISNELTFLGWESYATSGSGDQGADVIAEKNGIKLIVQCKLYSSPIGNKAVQEVTAAKGFYNGDVAAVITNNEFTKSARQLAKSLGVYLVHHSQINSLDELLFEYDHEEPESLGDG